ncbi:response regulator [Bradyrhizobium sp. SSUT77]|nr:response regulator [Bradyrhizobium sp. SSUT77]MDH2346327.1 response regulator [Bradyrhizobium sp. SSUT77]
MVRTYVENELKTLGYRVITAASGPAALDLLRQSGDIDLLFTDVVMLGGMFGPELARQAIRLRPRLKVLFTSGYSQNPVKAPDGVGDARIQAVPAARPRRDAAVSPVGAVAIVRNATRGEAPHQDWPRTGPRR